jgi:hypothetical protein
VISQHPFLRLLKAAAVLLVFAAVPSGAEGARAQGVFAEITGAGPEPPALDDRAQERQPDPAIAAAARLDLDDEKGLDGGSEPRLVTFVPSALRLVVRASRCAPAPTHRPCAAPPTGPPHA